MPAVHAVRTGSAIRAWIALSLVVALAVAGATMSLAPRSAAAADFALGQTVYVNTDALNLRTGPGLTATVIAVLPTGTEAVVGDGPVAADGFTWYGLQVGSQWGWSAGEYLAAVDDGTTTFPVGSTVVVATDALNLRAAPGLTGAVVAVLPNGTTGTVGSTPVSADGYTWYRLQVGAQFGWSAGEYLALAGDDGDDEIGVGDAVRVVDGPLNLRTGPGLGFAIFGVMPTGTLLEVRGGPTVADGYTWFQVFNFGYGLGWAASEFVEIDPAGFPSEEGGV